MGLIGLRGRASYSHLSRYRELTEKTYRRWFGRRLDFIEFNRLGIHEISPATHAKIAALDASFMEKSGEKMDGLGKFYTFKQSKAEKGLEISTLAVMDVDDNTAYQVSTRQTPPQAKNAEETHVHEYLRHFKDDCHALPKDVRYRVTDAYDSKQTFTHGVRECGYHPIGKLRRDANLRYLVTGQQKPKGRYKRYDGKLIIGDISRLEFVGEQNGVSLYTAVVNSVTLKRTIRVVYLLRNTGYAVLFSTDTELDALTLYLYYKARFLESF
jgi:hypothetical protein